MQEPLVSMVWLAGIHLAGTGMGFRFPACNHGPKIGLPSCIACKLRHHGHRSSMANVVNSPGMLPPQPLSENRHVCSSLSVRGLTSFTRGVRSPEISYRANRSDPASRVRGVCTPLGRDACRI
ncbi:uncharacterized protein B0I36DRAFT_316889 [Microdochium trichocladiopsis]|uniref:Uncharacterized protein n=1 Tax=Microdochium trichocladiopsis TaxID=1682393 RepID=A0A9P9BSG2_9PEZI|nr:uncharacterized protein B0I36DRAFT_316889 [Microdochium trichocladiopsis]KAH7034755.1 hypothetical protein B0I36DRAFT_316889 [Microdochium trichocladiopsis]